MGSHAWKLGICFIVLLLMSGCVSSNAPSPEALTATCTQENYPEGKVIVSGGECVFYKELSPEPVERYKDVLAVYVQGAMTGRGDRSVIDYASRFMAGLQKMGIRCIILDWPGYGHSSSRHITRFNLNHEGKYSLKYIDFFATFARDIKTLYKAKRLVAVGHSSGATVIGSTLGRAPGVVDVAVLYEGNYADGKGRRTMRSFLKAIPGETKVLLLHGGSCEARCPGVTRNAFGFLKKRGIAVEKLEYPGLNHGGIYKEKTWEDIRQYLEGNL